MLKILFTLTARCGALIVCLAAALGFCAGSALAQGVTLEEAVARALARNPTLQADGYAIAAAESQARLNALAPPWMAGGEFENFAGSGALSGVSGAETTLRLNRVIELGGKREARIALGAAAVARQRHAAERSRIEIAGEVTRRFIEVVADQERLAIARQNLQLTEQTRATVARWVEAGRSPESDLRQSEIAVARASLALDDAEHELASARLALSSLWGELDPGFTTADGELETLPKVADFATLAARLPESTDQRAYTFDADALAAERRVAIAGARPDVSVSLGVRRLETLDDQALVMGLSVPLGSARRSALEVERYDAELAGVEARRSAARLDARQRLFALVQELQHARHVFETHRDEIIPKAESALALNRRGYELGRFSFLALTQAQQVLVELRATQVEAAARYHRLLVDIERLTAISGATTP